MLTEAQVQAMREEAKVAAILDLQQQIATLTVRLAELEARLGDRGRYPTFTTPRSILSPAVSRAA